MNHIRAFNSINTGLVNKSKMRIRFSFSRQLHKHLVSEISCEQSWSLQMEADANWNNKNGATRDIVMADTKYSNIVLKSTMTAAVFS